MKSMLLTREQIEEKERQTLAPYAIKSGESAGRVYPEAEGKYRTAFQKDRDKIIHSKAFRRLQEKTQVFVAYEGDHYRNRMTHSIECSQISRAFARSFGLNEDLAEAIALAHDLGHPPFGHAGEKTIDEILGKYGRHFEHNEQSLRIVEKLEEMYPDFVGLNLTKEVLDGLLKHRTPYDQPKMKFITSPHLEAQIVDLADEIAYTSHDIDDGLRSSAITIPEIEKLGIAGRAFEKVLQEYPDIESERRELLNSRMSSQVLHDLVQDVCTESEKRIRENNISSLEDVRGHEGKLMSFSESVQSDLKVMRKFLLKEFYFSKKVKKQNEGGQEVIKKLFDRYYKNPGLMPANFQSHIDAGDPIEIVVKDYIAGMTDSFAEEQLGL